MKAHSNNHVLVISTGGTIACTADERGALVPTLTAAQLVEQSASPVPVRTIDATSLDSCLLYTSDAADE